MITVRVFCFFAIFWLFTGQVGAQLQHGDAAIRVVGTDEVNVRLQPVVNDETFLTKIARGTMMKRLDKRDGWYQVLLLDGRVAWMHGRYAEEVIARDLLEVSKATVNVRSSPTTAGRLVDQVKQGDMLSMVRERNGWFQAILPNKKRGWVRNDMVIRRYLTPPESADTTPAPTEAQAEPVPLPEPRVDYYQEAKGLLSDGKMDDAIAAFEKAIENKPKDANIHFDLAKVFKQQERFDEALTHFRKAQQLGGRDEARFYIEDILKAREKPAEDTPEDIPAEEEVDVVAEVLALLPWVLVGGVIFLGGLGFVFLRRRRMMKPNQPSYRRRKQDAGFDSVLKYAVEKRPLFRAIEEAERKRLELDASLQQRLSAFGGDGPRLPPGESSEALLKRIEDLRKVIVNQEERAQIYADLVVLQNEKLAALDEEIEALKELIQIDYQEGAAKAKSQPPR